MVEEDFDTIVKCIIVGDEGVGKASLTRCYAYNTFSEISKKTIGADFVEKRTFLKKAKREVLYHIWNTAGRECYDTLTKKYYKGASVCMIVFSSDSRQSLDNVYIWKQKVELECGCLPTILVQTKYDLAENAAFSNYDAENVCSKLGLPLFRTSAKSGSNVEAAFDFLASQYLCDTQEKAKETGPLQTIDQIMQPEPPIEGKPTRTRLKGRGKLAQKQPLSPAPPEKQEEESGCVLF